MARLAALFTVIFLVLTVSHARLIKQKETVINLPESDLTTTDVLDLPSEKSDSEPAKLVDYKHDYVTELDSEPAKVVDYKHDDVTEVDYEPAKVVNNKDDDVTEVDYEPAKVANYKHDDAMEAESESDSFPLTMISFRPVNGHFPRHPLIPFRHKHNCRQHKRLRPLNRRFQRKRYISYDNDMILSDETTRSDSESASQIQSGWAGSFDNGAESNEHVDTYDHEHEQDHDGDHYHHSRGEEDERHESEEQDGGFMERFSKFLINF